MLLAIMILSIVACCAILGISIKGYFTYLTKEHNQELLEKEKEELRQKEEQERLDRLDREEKERQYRLKKEEQERLDRLDREEKERQYRLDKEERDWIRKVQFEEMQKKERIDLQHYKDNYNETHIVKTISFGELTDALNFLITRVWTHEEHYYLKANDIVVPRIEEETIKFGVLVLSHMSHELRQQALLYYSMDGLLYYIHGVFNDLIWKYATDRNELQGLYKYLYSNNRSQLKKDLAKVREEAKTERLKNNGDLFKDVKKNDNTGFY